MAFQIPGAAWTEHSWHFSSRFKQEARSAGEIFQPKFTGCDQSDMVIFVGFPNSHASIIYSKKVREPDESEWKKQQVAGWQYMEQHLKGRMKPRPCESSTQSDQIKPNEVTVTI